MDSVDKYLDTNKINLSDKRKQRLRDHLNPFLITPNTPLEAGTVCQLFFEETANKSKTSRKTRTLTCRYFESV